MSPMTSEMLIPSYFPWYIHLIMILKQSDIEDSASSILFYRKLKIQLLCIKSKKELDLEIITGTAGFASSIFIISTFYDSTIPM